MSKIFASTRVKQLRYLGPVESIPVNRRLRVANNSDAHIEKSLEYLIRVIERILVSEKYVLDAHMLALDVRPEADKLLIKTALEAVANGNWIRKITSSNRKSVSRTFKGSIGSTSAYKRMYIRFNSPFDPSILTGGES